MSSTTEFPETPYSRDTTKSDGLSKDEIILVASITGTVGLVIMCMCCSSMCMCWLRYRTARTRRKIMKDVEQCSERVKTDDEKRYTVLHKKRKIDQWEISMANLVVLDNEKLGSGAFATVFKGILKGRAPIVAIYGSVNMALEMHDTAINDVAVKMLPPHADEAHTTDFLGEIDFMKELGYHAHVINMLGCVSDPSGPMLVVEYCAHGDLLRFLRTQRAVENSESKNLSTKNLISIAWQISDGMTFLSSRNYIHRDVAARNVLLTSKMVAKVSDFGLCRYNDQALYTTRGGRLPIKWMAIESLRFMVYTTKSDVYVYSSLTHLGSNKKDRNEIMTSCWQAEPDARPSFDEIRSKLSALLEMNSETYGYLQVSGEHAVSHE